MSLKSSQKKPSVQYNQSFAKCSNNLAFSFKFFTANKKYNFENIKDNHDLRKWKSSLAEKIIEVSQNDWKSFLSYPKNSGMETIFCRQLNFIPNNYTFSPDEKVFIMRFASGKGRIIGVKDGSCSIFHVIGVDVDFSAYNHG